MAVEKLTMPQLGESVTEGMITKWLVSPGDFVRKYEPIAEVMTDKVNAEIPSSFTGTIKELAAEEGISLKVGEVICLIETEAEKENIDAEAETGATLENREVLLENSESVTSGNLAKPRYSPAVLALSQKHHIDLTKIKGTGRGGRITRKDVMAYIENRSDAVPKVGIKEETKETPAMRTDKMEEKKPVLKAGDVEIPVSGIRRVIAANMTRSKTEIPHAWTMVEADVTGLVAYRDGIKDEFKKKEGFPITYFAFFVKAAAQALREYPELNSTWQGDKIIQRKDIHISIAVAAEDALFVPVIRHADEKSIKGIARDIYELSEKVRNKKLLPEDSRDGTFTVNNTGSFGSVQSMGIINYPQAAILQVESIVKRPVVMPGSMIAIRDIVNLCLSLDHRVLDGLICGRFLQRVKEILENMNENNISVY